MVYGRKSSQSRCKKRIFSGVSEKSVVRKTLAPKTETKKARSANNIAIQTYTHPNQPAETAEPSKYRKNLRGKLWNT